MKKEAFMQIFYRLEEIYLDDRAKNKAMKSFFAVIAPTEYAPVLDGTLSTVLWILKIEHPEIVELLEYYFYEAKNMEHPYIESDGKKYDYLERGQVVQSLVDFWHIE